MCLRCQRTRVELGLHRVGPEVQEHPAPAQHRLPVHQQIDQAGAVPSLAHVERPLVALEEHQRHQPAVVRDRLGEELPLVVAVFVGGDEPRHHLHVGAGDVPARFDRGQPELPLGDVLTVHSRPVGGPRRTPLPVREHPGGVDPGRTTGGVDDVGAAQQQVGGALPVVRDVGAQHQQAGDLRLGALTAHDEVHHPAVVVDRGAVAGHLLLQLLHHRAGGVRAHRGGPAARVVVGLVADELPVPVLRERHAQVAQPQERAGGECGLGERVVPVHRPAGEQCLGHLVHRVAVRAGEGELVVGLFVRAGVPAGPGTDLIGDHHHVRLAELPEPVGGAEAGGASAHHHRIRGHHRHVAPVDRQRLGSGKVLGGGHRRSPLLAFAVVR